jgi:hypothetical protein
MENDSIATSALCEALHATGRIDFAERDVMEYRAATSLFRLDVGCPDYLAPLLGFVGDELAKTGGR